MSALQTTTPDADYRGFIIDWDCDGHCYRAVHVDFDGAPDANDNRIFWGSTRKEVKEEVDCWHEEQAA